MNSWVSKLSKKQVGNEEPFMRLQNIQGRSKCLGKLPLNFYSLEKTVHFWSSFLKKPVYSPKYVTIYRSILKFLYIDRYMISNIERYMKFFKNHFPTDICRNLSFFDRYMKIFIFLKLAILGFLDMRKLHISVNIIIHISVYIKTYTKH